MSVRDYSVGPIRAAGAFTSEITLPGRIPLDQIADAIDRDRVQMALRPGMRQKHLPTRFDPATGNLLAGGRYLFDTFEHAQEYKNWAENDFQPEGVPFFQRPFFIHAVYHVWRVLGAHDFTALHTTHHVMRFEHWQVPSGAENTLQHAWPAIEAEAAHRGLASAWLLHTTPDNLVGLVTIAARVAPASFAEPDDASLHALESSPSLGVIFDRGGWTKVLDRTSWILTIWLPLTAGAPDVPALWPNSPPLPAPAYAAALT